MNVPQNALSSPRIAITMGDPAGIGPEIAIKALGRCVKKLSAEIFIIGETSILSRAVRACGISAQFQSLESSTSPIQSNVINILDVGAISVSDVFPGVESTKCGAASFAYIEKSIELGLRGEIDAVVTCPISKHSLHSAGYIYPGHTEIFAQKTSTLDYAMTFLLDKLAVVHVTTHCSLRSAIDAISTPLVLKNINLLNTFLIQLGIDNPRIAVGGLNPHAGENGLFGDEEISHIAPAVAQAREQGIDARGPFPPDTVFMRAFENEFDGVVSMLHDHGFVALKSRDFSSGVNVTIGLPFIRTSVGHGTAFDKAGKGIASEQSLCRAIDTAVLLARSKHTRYNVPVP